MRNSLPNFLIVGAAKCGTSSLHNYLNQHPDVFMPSYNEQGMKAKEPRFLIKDLVKDRLHNGVWDLESYQALFNNVVNEKAIGESTVLYLYYYNEAIKNIKKYLGDDVKIIIMLRNPVDRAFSAYTHVSRSLKEPLSFEEALEVEENRLENDITLTPMVMYKDMGLYHNMVSAYIENFKNVHVVMHEDFLQNTKAVVKLTLAFLGILRSVELDTDSKYNVGGKSWRFSFLKQFFMKDNVIKKELRVIFPKTLRKRFRVFLEYFLKEKVKPIKPGTKKELISFFRSDVEKLEKLLNIDLKNWKE
ncbi:MAG: Uncharacterised protein [Cryomorphaceae bacterium]|nr:MAG: Uncharacterised protein [Cryomorphaceae bacterium]